MNKKFCVFVAIFGGCCQRYGPVIGGQYIGKNAKLILLSLYVAAQLCLTPVKGMRLNKIIWWTDYYETR